MLLLELLFVILMSLPWLVPHCGFTALFGLVPLLCMERVASNDGSRRFWMWHYSAFALWNAATTFWVCNATVGGGIFAILANAAQMSLIFGIFRFSKKKLGGVLPYIFLAAMWIAWERAYFDAQISWPWLTLGNAFARSAGLIQWYEYTGTLGGSLWVWIVNLGLFGLMVALSDGSWWARNGKARLASVLGLAFSVLGPISASVLIDRNYPAEDETSIDCIIGQPNFDPYQKFQSLDQQSQDAILLDIYEQELSRRPAGKPVILLAPETFTSDIVCGQYQDSPTWNRFDSFLDNHPDAGILFGASTREYLQTQSNPNDYPMSGNRGWIRFHNSALSLDADGNTELYHKSRLVVGTEMTPYPKILLPLSNSLGVSIGRCVGQDEASLLHLHGVPLGCAVCYESVFGEFCTEYVRRGAQALTIITNDAWWGDTPGYKQHLSYACLRAIELRRDIARCANTGLSAFIDSRGRIVSQSRWWEKQALSGSVRLSTRMTFFVKYGDITGRVCTFLFILLLLTLIVRCITGRK